MEATPFYLDGSGVLRVSAFERFEWLEHGFGTKLSDPWPDRTRLSMLKQIHSSQVVIAHGEAGYIGEGDGLITNHPGSLVGVRTADCVPILLVDSKQRVVAAVHAGWRGTAKEIGGRCISEMVQHFGTVAENVYAAIGPAIGPCCYEVGPDVAREFSQWWPELGGIEKTVKLNLPAANVQQLIQAGVPVEQIFTGAPCTFCTDTLHSFRRERENSGRMIAAIGIRS